MIGCDPIVAAGKATLAAMRDGRTYVALNTHAIADRRVRQQPRLAVPGRQLRGADRRRGRRRCIRRGRCRHARGAAGRRLDLHQPAAARLRLAAGPRAAEPRRADARDRAERRAGRRTTRRRSSGAGAPRTTSQAVQALVDARPGDRAASSARSNLDELIARRVEFLTAYQNAAYARAVPRLCRQGARRPRRRASAARSSTEAVARYLFKLMAYKDEYEVARLHAETGFRDQIAERFEGDYKIAYHLAPPMTAKRNEQGELLKRRFGPWIHTAFQLLAPLKVLRGTPFDPFGSHRGTPHRAGADRRIPCVDRRGDGDARRGQPAAGARDRAHPGRDPRLRPREGAPARGGAPEVGAALMAQWRAGGERKAA